MFNIEFLHVIREFEYAKIIRRLPAGSTILEIGGGTGYQAKRLTEDGYCVTSIDIPTSNYAAQQEFFVQPYDGRNIPFADRSFDIVFSSNVLEHVRDLALLQTEIRRVLRSGGICVHLMPSGTWRFWTNFAHYTELLQRLAIDTPRLFPRSLTLHALLDVVRTGLTMLRTIRHYLIVPRHGESGNAFTEVFTFSSMHWRRHFKRCNFSLEEVAPAGLFYTGHMVLGKRISISTRQHLSRLLGSACVIYVVRSQ